MKLYLTALFGLIPINVIKIFFLRLLGHDVSFKSKIGFSVLFVNTITIGKFAKIGNFNFIKAEELNLEKHSFIGSLNVIKGPIFIHLKSKSGISKQNKIRRANYPITYGNSKLQLGFNSFVVSNHFLDLTKSVTIGENSIIAGVNSQFWTHGYYHADNGTERIRIDGEIKIGDNVYIGSSCIFNPGIKVNNAIHIGAGSVISKNLEKSGMYVNQGLRFIDNNIEKVKSKLEKVNDLDLVEQVYTKK